MRLSDKEVSIVLGATLMHWGVPFRRAAKRELTDQQQAIVDKASDKLLRLRDACQQLQVQEAQEVSFSDEETTLLIMIIQDCLDECTGDATELGLQLKTRRHEDVESLLGRLRALRGPRQAKLA